MGKLVYGHGHAEYVLDDRTLNNLQHLVSTKFRRHESFVLNLVTPGGCHGPVTLWMSHEVPVRLVFDSCDTHGCDVDSVTSMLRSSACTGSLTLALDSTHGGDA